MEGGVLEKGWDRKKGGVKRRGGGRRRVFMVVYYLYVQEISRVVWNVEDLAGI